MKPKIFSIPLALAAFAVSPLVSSAATSISGSVYTHLDTNIWAWIGTAMVSIDNQTPKFSTVVFQGIGDAIVPPGQVDREGMWGGSELMVMTFVDGSGSIEFTVKYRATPEAALGLFAIHEVGTVSKGTGDYVGISGTISLDGAFVGASAALEYNLNEDPAAPLLCIGAIHGQVSGLSAK